ncbi:bactofilin family protein [Sunxiuqinia indica]|uniref:bactofilin family protein n=1 Tax=Sunxiuqinia indica TaxID=2692584 RepID=UPI001357DA1A|nr:polymer-forming cytoskeletal protein [Sunxiuqinia indica]
MGKANNETDSQGINLIGKGTRITGDVASDGDIRIDGELNGNLDCSGRVVIGVSGKVTGEIKCKNSEISGYQKGKLKVEQLLSLKSSSKVYAEISTGKLSIEPGALFSGSCAMGEQTKHEGSGKLQKA